MPIYVGKNGNWTNCRGGLRFDEGIKSDEAQYQKGNPTEVTFKAENLHFDVTSSLGSRLTVGLSPGRAHEADLPAVGGNRVGLTEADSGV